MSALLLGLGTALPEGSIAQERAAEVLAALSGLDARAAARLRALLRRSGVDRRGSVLVAGGTGEIDPAFLEQVAGERGPSTGARMEIFERRAPELAERAARAALDASGVEPRAITHLVLVTCTGFFAPGPETLLVEALGLDPGLRRLQLGFLGCAGALSALALASELVRGEPRARVLVCAVELCTLHFQLGLAPELAVGNALFADGAAAAVVAAEGAHGSAAPWRIRAAGSRLFPDSTDAMRWRVRDHGFELALSPRVPELIERSLAPWLEPWLEEHEAPLRAIRSFAVHPGGPRILDSVGAALALSREDLGLSRELLLRHGNMSSPTVLFLLGELAERGARGPCLALGFGPGLVAETLLVER